MSLEDKMGQKCFVILFNNPNGATAKDRLCNKRNAYADTLYKTLNDLQESNYEIEGVYNMDNDLKEEFI